MAKRLEDVLEGQEANYILPFIWQRGEDETIIRFLSRFAQQEPSGLLGPVRLLY